MISNWLIYFIGWAADITRGLEKYYKFVSIGFFTFLYCFVVFILMNIVTGVILDAISEVDKEEENDENEENEKYLNLIQDLDSIYERIETFESKMLILGGIEKPSSKEEEEPINVADIQSPESSSKEELKGFPKFLSILEKVVNHRIYFGVDVVLTMIKILLSVIISLPSILNSTIKFTNQIYIGFGVAVYPLYTFISILIFILFVLKLVGLKKKYFYDDGFCYLNIADFILIISDVILNFISFIFFILTMSRVTSLYYLFFGFFITLRILVVRLSYFINLIIFSSHLINQNLEKFQRVC